MKLAVIATGGKQYVVEEGSVVTIEKLPGDLKVGDEVTFSEVLLTADGEKVMVGAPHTSAKVSGVVTEVGKGEKKIIFRYNAKSNRTKKKGHRQEYLKVKINKV